MKIDWKLLRDQKLFLYALADSPNDHQRSNAWGLINLLDALQDDAVDSGEASEEEVFGPVESEMSLAEQFDRFEEAMADRFCQELEE
jgi:hypothetical protein